MLFTNFALLVVKVLSPLTPLLAGKGEGSDMFFPNIALLSPFFTFFKQKTAYERPYFLYLRYTCPFILYQSFGLYALLGAFSSLMINICE